MGGSRGSRLIFGIMAWAALAAVGIALNVQSTRAAGVKVRSAPPAIGDASPGPVVYWDEVLTAPRPVRVDFLRIDLANPEFEVVTIIDPHPDDVSDATAILRKPIPHHEDDLRHAAADAVVWPSALHRR